MSDHDGQPCSVYAADCIAVVICHCRLGNTPILISSTQVEAVCQYCRSAYGILAIGFEAGQPGVAVKIGRREYEPADAPAQKKSTSPFRRMQ